jgi:hypothetical protein
MYVPGGASLEMGPTAILPRSHVLGADPGESWHEAPTDIAGYMQELKLVAPEGQGRAVLIHYDIVHRGTARLVGEHEALWRPMLKFQFQRTVAPQVLVGPDPIVALEKKKRHGVFSESGFQTVAQPIVLRRGDRI